MDMQFYPQASFSSMPGYPAGQPGFIQYPEGQYTGQPGYGIQYMYQFAQPRSAYMGEHAALVDGKTESKPRLTKEEVDRLEKEFRKNPKPSSSVKAQLADSLRLERARINVFSPDYLDTIVVADPLSRTGSRTGEPRQSRRRSRKSTRLVEQLNMSLRNQLPRRSIL